MRPFACCHPPITAPSSFGLIAMRAKTSMAAAEDGMNCRAAIHANYCPVRNVCDAADCCAGTVSAMVMIRSQFAKKDAKDSSARTVKRILVFAAVCVIWYIAGLVRRRTTSTYVNIATPIFARIILYWSGTEFATNVKHILHASVTGEAVNATTPAATKEYAESAVRHRMPTVGGTAKIITPKLLKKDRLN